MLAVSLGLSAPKLPMADALPAPDTSAYARLPRRRKRFVDQYVVGCSGAEALRQAGYKGLHPNVIASKWLRKPDVAAAIEERTREVLAECGVRHERVVRELYAVATLDPRRVVDPKTGKAVPLEQMDPATAAAISSVEVENISINGETGTRYKYRFWDKGKALDKLGQYLKLWDGSRPTVNVDARSVTVNAGGPEVLRAVDDLLARAAAVGIAATAAQAHPHGPVLPAPVRNGQAGRGSPLDADPDSGSAGGA